MANEQGEVIRLETSGPNRQYSGLLAALVLAAIRLRLDGEPTVIPEQLGLEDK